MFVWVSGHIDPVKLRTTLHEVREKLSLADLLRRQAARMRGNMTEGTDETERHLRVARGGWLAHAVPIAAPWVDGRAVCGYQPSARKRGRRYMVERHGWESAGRTNPGCRKCAERVPRLYDGRKVAQ